MIRKIERYLAGKGIEHTVHLTTSKQDAIDSAKALSGKGILCAVGGDGTFHDVINGADLTVTPIGFIPCGRGNDFAFGTKLIKKPMKALKAVLDNRAHEIDYIDISGLKCLNVAGTGLDVAVLQRVYEGKSLTYLGSVMYNLKHFDSYKVKVTSENDSFEGECVMVGICNGTQIGGGIKLSPRSLIDDGKINVMIIKVPATNLTKALLNFKAGKHLEKPYVQHFLCDKVTVETPGYPIQLDGEIYENVPLNCSVVKGGLKTFY